MVGTSLLEPAAASLGVMRSPAFAHSGWRKARDRAWEALEAGPCLVVVAAAPGLGKTLLVRDLVARLAESGRDVLMHPSDDTLVALPPGIVLAIDDADQVDEETVATIADATDESCVLACTPRFAERIVAAIARTTLVKLSPLDPDETGLFVVSELARAGYPDGFATDDAVARLELESGGVPRNLGRLTRAAAFLARRERAFRMTGPHVDRVVAIRSRADASRADAAPKTSAERDLPAGEARSRPSPLRYMTLLASIATIAVLIVCVAVFSKHPAPPSHQDGEHAARSPAPSAAQGAALAPAAIPQRPADEAGADVARMPAVKAATSEPPPLVASPVTERSPEEAQPSPTAGSPVIATAGPPAAAFGATNIPITPTTSMPRTLALTPQLPRGAPVHVVVTFLHTDSRSRLAAQRVVDGLREKGFLVADATPSLAGDASAARRSSTGPLVRYYYIEDHDTADALGRDLGAGLPPGLVIQPTTSDPAIPGTVQIAVSPGHGDDFRTFRTTSALPH